MINGKCHLSSCLLMLLVLRAMVAIFGKHWFWGVWPASWTSLNITFLELFPIVLLSHIFATYGQQMRGFLHG